MCVIAEQHAEAYDNHGVPKMLLGFKSFQYGHKSFPNACSVMSSAWRTGSFVQTGCVRICHQASVCTSKLQLALSNVAALLQQANNPSSTAALVKFTCEICCNCSMWCIHMHSLQDVYYRRQVLCCLASWHRAFPDGKSNCMT